MLFAAIAVPLLVAYYFPYASDSWVHKLLEKYLRGYAAAAGTMLRVFEPNIRVNGQDILGRYSMRIVKTCDGMDVNILFASAVLAWPTGFRQRLVAVATGLTLLSVMNVLRICTLYCVGVYAPTSFELVHIELWPIAILAAAAGSFMAFTRYARP